MLVAAKAQHVSDFLKPIVQNSLLNHEDINNVKNKQEITYFLKLAVWKQRLIRRRPQNLRQEKVIE